MQKLYISIQILTIIFLLSSPPPTWAHMNLLSSLPLNHPDNPNRNASRLVPQDLDFPLTANKYPYQGYISLLGTSEAKPVATWPAGSNQTFE
ncbi:hypothetical protein RUND412_007108 [Rhizina undulata]